MSAVTVDIDDASAAPRDLVLIERCPECHVAPGQRCTTWWGAMHGAWHTARSDAARAKLPAP